MNLSTPFIHRPVGTTLLTDRHHAGRGDRLFSAAGFAAAGRWSFPRCKSPRRFPATAPRRWPRPWPRRWSGSSGRIAGITEMTSTQLPGLDEHLAAIRSEPQHRRRARDVQAAINAARGHLPANLPSNPTWSQGQPGRFADHDPGDHLRHLHQARDVRCRRHDRAAEALAGRPASDRSSSAAARRRRCAWSVNPTMLNHFGLGLEDVAPALGHGERQSAQGANFRRPTRLVDQHHRPALYGQRVSSRSLSRIARVRRSVWRCRHGDRLSRGPPRHRPWNGKPFISLIVFRQPRRTSSPPSTGFASSCRNSCAEIPADMNLDVAMDRTATIRDSVHDVQFALMVSDGVGDSGGVSVPARFADHVHPQRRGAGIALGTFGVMYLGGYSIDNLSLMALDDRHGLCRR